MTTRLDHTNCGHALTAAARKVCRDRRNGYIRQAQRAYLAVDLDPDFAGQNEYEAMVDLFSMRYGMDLHDAYALIERGPVVH